MSIVTTKPCYEAAQRFIELMRSEAPQLYQSFLSYNASETHYGVDGKPRWMPFDAQIHVDSGLYKRLCQQACENYPPDDKNRWNVASLAKAITQCDDITFWEDLDGPSS